MSNIDDAIDLDVGYDGRTNDNMGCAVRAGGVISCWNWVERFQSSAPPLIARDVAVFGDAVEVAVAAIPGGYFACVRLRGGSVECIGDSIRTPVTGLHDAVALVAGAFHACALRANGMVVCFGSDDAGQLGGSMFHIVGAASR